jgi:UDP-N-acetyl-D-glucosamine dehydrogenase
MDKSRTMVTGDIEAKGRLKGASALIEKLKRRSARVGVIGMGYVGLPTMVAAAQGGYTVVGIDISKERVSEINAGRSYIEGVKEFELGPLVEEGKISATTDYSNIHDLDVVLVCVPTPITKNKEPDLTAMEQAIGDLADHMRKGQLIVLQSTSFPGTTEEFVLPKLQRTGWQPGFDFYLAFALERVDPGNETFSVRNVPKVVGGLTGVCTEVATAFFSGFVDQVIPVSSPKVAEMTKLLENTFRSVNIALVNELAILCRRMDIDIWEVIDAASTKPFGFMPFYPGPGVGGHCIPVDPFYLAWKAKEYDFYVNFIQLAAEINDNMPYHTVSRIVDVLGEQGRPLKGSRLLILGVTFKENIRDTRNSPAVHVLELLLRKGAEVEYSDYHVPVLNLNGKLMKSVEVDPESLGFFDAVIILVNHRECNLTQIVNNSKLVLDARNATGALGPLVNVVKL